MTLQPQMDRTRNAVLQRIQMEQFQQHYVLVMVLIEKINYETTSLISSSQHHQLFSVVLFLVGNIWNYDWMCKAATSLLL